MNKGDFTTRAQLTARIFITPAGTTNAINCGDLNGHKKNLERSGADVTIAEKGFRRKVGNLTSEVAWGYEFDLNEQFGPINALAAMGTQGADNTQAAVTAPSGTASFSSVLQGRSYLIGKYNLNTVVVSVSASPKTENVDYTIDLGSGEIYIIPGGGIANADNISVTFGCAATTFENYTTLDKANAQSGAIVLQEFDQHSQTGVPFRITTFTGQYWVSGSEDHDGKKPAMQKLQLLATTRPAIKNRTT